MSENQAIYLEDLSARNMRSVIEGPMLIKFSLPAIDQIAASLSELVTIQQQRLALETKAMISAQNVKDLLDIIKTAQAADATDKGSLTQALADKDALQATVADLNDPALNQSVTDVITAAHASVPPVVVPPVVVPPA